MNRVIDANLTVALVLATPYSAQAQVLWSRWDAAAADLFVPDLWAYEVTSALCQAMSITGMPLREARLRLETLMHLEVELVPPTLALNDLALQWAERLGQAVAYHAQYLALAETLDCEFWTADRRLADAVGDQVVWVHWIGALST